MFPFHGPSISEVLTVRRTNSVLFRSLNLLKKRDRARLGLVTIAQILSGILDLAGVAMIGALCALAIQGIESRGPGTQTSKVLNILHIEHFNFHTQIIVIGIASITLLSIKTVFSILSTRKIFRFLSIKGAEISGDMISRILSKDLLFIKRRSTQEILFIISDGVRSLTSGILATLVTMASDISMLVILSIGLYIIDPIIAISTTCIFLAIAIILYKLLHARAQQIGVEVETLIVRSNQKIVEVLATYRESVVHGRRQFYAQQITSIRREYGEISAELMFQPYIGKYVIESISIFGAFALAGFEFATKNAVHAISILSIFIAASTRIAPAILRVQQGFLIVKTSTGTARSTLTMVEEIKDVILRDENVEDDFSKHDAFISEVLLSDIFFAYPNTNHFALNKISLDIRPGTSVAIVGPSGAGKTTLADLILGVLVPQSGILEISGLPPAMAVKQWPGSISYVPQDVEIVSGTIRENVGLGYEAEIATDGAVWKVLEIAQLKDLVEKMEFGLDTQVGERGSKISGGQRQRLGIARALFTSPKLLVLDEATSALDGQTVLEISKALSRLSEDVTVIIVAHRLSTVRDVDQVIYVDQGRIIAKGTFDEVRSLVPDFDIQAKLIGS